MGMSLCCLVRLEAQVGVCVGVEVLVAADVDLDAHVDVSASVSVSFAVTLSSCCFSSNVLLYVSASAARVDSTGLLLAGRVWEADFDKWMLCARSWCSTSCLVLMRENVQSL